MGRIDSTLSLCQEGALECGGESYVWGFKSTRHIKPGTDRIMSLKLLHIGMKIKMLINEHIYQTMGSYLLCSSSRLTLGDFDETPCLLANLLATINAVSNAACLLGAPRLCVLEFLFVSLLPWDNTT